MTWTRLSDDFTDRPEMLEISRSARLLHVEAMVWCNRHLRDGRLPRAALARITDAPDVEGDVAELEKAGLWTVLDPDLWQLDWSDQEDAEDVRQRSEYRAEVQRRYRDRKARHDRGDHSACDSRYCKKAVTGNASSNKSTDETPSRPVPSRPEGRDRDQGARTGSAGATPSGAAGNYRDADCPHGMAGGMVYKTESRKLRCPRCAEVAPLCGSHFFPNWVEQMREQGYTDAHVAEALQEHGDDVTDISIEIAVALYRQFGGQHTVDGDPTDERFLEWLEFYVIHHLTKRPENEES